MAGLISRRHIATPPPWTTSVESDFRVGSGALVYHDRIAVMIVGAPALAKLLDRSVVTVRAWVRENKLPKELRPKRDKRKRLVWKDEQLPGLRQFAEDSLKRQGWPASK